MSRDERNISDTGKNIIVLAKPSDPGLLSEVAQDYRNDKAEKLPPILKTGDVIGTQETTTLSSHPSITLKTRTGCPEALRGYTTR